MLTAEPNAVGMPGDSTALPGAQISWKVLVEPIEPFLRAVSHRLNEQIEAFDPQIAGYAQYALSGHGKKLRPALVAFSGKATGALGDAHTTVAVIIEMVHLATLVHDDIIDEATVRRQRPTLAHHCGNEISVLLGDCLFAHALKLAASFPTPEVCRTVASATYTVCAGEILQTRYRGKIGLSRADYFKVLEMKTAELFALSCELGAWPNGSSEADKAALRSYGLALGTAYQLYDDCLDLFGTETQAGKSLGTDLRSGKATFPILVAMERVTVKERALLEASIVSGRPDLLPDVLALLHQYGVLAEAQASILHYLDLAQQAIRDLPASNDHEALVTVGEFLAQQIDRLRVGS